MAHLPKLTSGDGFLRSRIRCPELLRLHRSESPEHFVQFYQDDSFLIDNVSYLAAKALETDQSSVLVATGSHLTAIERRLSAFGLKLDGLRETGRYMRFDAADALSRIMSGNQVDADKFFSVIGGAIRAATETGANGFAFAFGEMVALLCADGNPHEAIALERLWNALANRYRFSLCCAYPLSSLETHPDMSVVMQICAEHALTIPAESPL
ncbi:MAG TPA: MEDS domain-containing protein [Candidatus Binataceae bacterium]|nr:MEDS domain-containing protein [Candidatus Binataceae bacterium]